MQTFTELNDKVIILINETQNKNKLLRLNNLKTQINTRKNYYDTIPNHIKTTSTLKYIINNLEFNLNQITNKQQEINTNYSEDSCTDIYNTTNVITDDELIAQLRNEILKLQTELQTSENNIAILQKNIDDTKKFIKKNTPIVDNINF